MKNAYAYLLYTRYYQGCSFPLTTQGQLSAVGTIVSAGYGFICGAYMPISNDRRHS